MTGSGDADVRFRNPPAVETLQGVFFRPLPKFSSAHQGLLWAKHFGQEFPSVEEKPRLEQVEERFGGEVLSAQAIRWRISDRPDTPRIWARSESGSHVLQIQRDAVLTNWLKQGSEDQYRHYEDRRADFAAKLRTVKRFFEEEHLGDLEPTSCLMTYVNHVAIDSLTKEPEVAADVFTFWSNKTTEGWLPCPDQLTVDVSFPMPDKKGRLHVQVVPAVVVRSDGNESVIQLELTARGKPSTNTVESALEWLDIGHEWIVRGFVDITRQMWHDKNKWERLS